MANSKIIIIEGAQGAGKTTVTDYLRHKIPYTNLYRMCGTADSTKAGLKKAEKMYEDLLEYIEKMQNLSINLLFDRTFFTEEIYCRLGFKEYVFTPVFEKLLEKLNTLDFEIHYITLYLEKEETFEQRLQREGKGVTAYAKYKPESSISQQREYLKLAEEVNKQCKNIKVSLIENSGDFEETKKKIEKVLGI